METLVKVTIAAILIVLPLLSFAVWTTDQLDVTETYDEKITVVASFYPLFDFTKAVSGDKINVELLIPNGVEPHDWDPSIRDIENIQKAEMIVINGMGFEGWLDRFLTINTAAKIIDTSAGIQATDVDDNDEHQFQDPHIWLNPVFVKSQVQSISDALQELDPDNAPYYQTNTDVYLKKLDALDSDIRNGLSSCKSDFVTYHNAFSYFASEYGLRQHAVIDSNDPHAEPTPKTFENVIELAKSLDIDVVFTEEGIDQRTLEVISKEINGRIAVLSPIEIGLENSDYIQRMETNLSNLRDALC